MSWASVSTETAQKTCTTVAQIPHPANRLHVDNRFVAFEYSPLPFRAKCNEGPKSRRVVYNLVLNLIRGTGSRINSVMAKKILLCEPYNSLRYGQGKLSRTNRQCFIEHERKSYYEKSMDHGFSIAPLADRRL